MEISITNLTTIDGEIIIHFDSVLGNGAGFWMSKNRPLVSSSYHVEFDVDEELIWQNNVHKADNETSFIKIDKETSVELQGAVEKIEDLNEVEDTEDSGKICFMRLDNSLFMFSCNNIPTDFLGHAKINIKSLKIFDTNS